MVNIFTLFFKKKHISFAFLVIILASTILFSACENKHETKIPKSLDELAEGKVAVLLGSVQDLKVTKECKNSEMMRMASCPELLTAVEKGLADYAVLDSASIVGANITGRGMQVNFTLPDHMPIAMAFRHDDTELCAQFNQFLAEIEKSGLLNEIRERWMTDKVLTAKMPKINIPTTGTPIRVATLDNDFPATFIKDGEFAGLTTELAYRFAEYIGRPIELKAYEFSSTIPTLVTGKADMIACFMAVTEERSKSVLFSDPYYMSGSACIGRSADSKAMNDNGLWSKLKSGFEKNIIAEQRWKLLVDGLWETIFISIFAILFGTVIGCMICALRMSRRQLCRGIAIAYVEIMRGVPILVFLMVMFYIVFATSKVTATWVAIIAFAMNFGAYVSEMFRTGIEGVDHGQVEAGRALGFSKSSTFVNFVLPQALRNVFPVFKGEAVSLIKNTSVVGYIAIQDLTKASDIIRSRTFDAFFPLIIITIIYFILAWLLGVGLDYLNKKTTRR